MPVCSALSTETISGKISGKMPAWESRGAATEHVISCHGGTACTRARMAEKNTSSNGRHSTPRPSFVTIFGQNIDPPATTHRDREVVSMALAHSSKKPESKRTTARRAALRQNLDTIRRHDHRL